ncbi:MAG: tRNA lysidine(34) synthetase TilS, partial [Kiritimatiellae bacterium]|nr:tRNA lysidine(34) synthetase TilS [Kiritimatiellia bacterium]
MSRPTPALPDPELLRPRPFGSQRLGDALRSARVVVALSGGADSTALLLSLVRLRSWLGAKPPYGIAAAHFNHCIRGAEADGDEAFCAAACKALGIEFFSEKRDVPAAAGQTGESVEMAARRMRRGFLERVAAATNAAAIATGHTLDDQAELFFLRHTRGASCRGLGGMASIAAWAPDPARSVIRPLLRVRHDALCAWLRSEGAQWREDSTNAHNDADRNKIRHAV